MDMTREKRRMEMQKMCAVVAESNINRWTGKILSALLKFDVGVNAHAVAAPMERNFF